MVEIFLGEPFDVGAFCFVDEREAAADAWIDLDKLEGGSIGAAHELKVDGAEETGNGSEEGFERFFEFGQEFGASLNGLPSVYDEAAVRNGAFSGFVSVEIEIYGVFFS